jgi:polyferredoxin
MALPLGFMFKVFQGPLLPVAGTVDLAPFLVMVTLLTIGAVAMRLRPSWRRQWVRRLMQTTAFCAFVVGLHPCACMIRDLLRGIFWINDNAVLAFQLMMLIVPVAAFAMVWGRVFCGWVCPIGFVQEMVSKLGAPLTQAHSSRAAQWLRFAMAAVLLIGTVVAYAFIRPHNEPLLQGMSAGYLIILAILILLSVADRQWELGLRRVRYIALAFFAGGTILNIHLQAAFCVLFTNDLQQTMLLLLGGVLIATVILSMAWCRFLCPEGALLSLLAPLSGWRVILRPGRCTTCHTCRQMCPVDAIDVGHVDDRSCLHCCRCIDACPTQAIDVAEAPGSRNSVVTATSPEKAAKP